MKNKNAKICFSGNFSLILPFPDHCLILPFISEFLWWCCVAALKSHSIHPFNALIFPILRDCLQSICIFLSLSGNLSLIVPFPYCILLPVYLYEIFRVQRPLVKNRSHLCQRKLAKQISGKVLIVSKETILLLRDRCYREVNHFNV